MDYFINAVLVNLTAATQIISIEINHLVVTKTLEFIHVQQTTNAQVQTTRSLRFPKPSAQCFSLSPGKIFRILSEGEPGGAGWTAVYGGECGPGSMVENSMETVAREVHEGQECVIEKVLV